MVGALIKGVFHAVPRVRWGCSSRRWVCISTKSAAGVLIEEAALHQYQECGRVLMEEGAFHFLSTKSAAGCSWRRGLFISLVPRVQHGAHRVGGFPSVPRVRRGCCGLGDFNVTKQNKQTSFALKDG